MMQEITEGITGQQAAEIIYANDVENNDFIKDVNPLTTYTIMQDTKTDPTVSKWIALTKNFYILAPSRNDYRISYFGINNVSIFNSIIGLQLLRQGGNPSNFRINKPMKAGGIYEMWVEAGSDAEINGVRLFYVPNVDIDTTTPMYFSFVNPQFINFTAQSFVKEAPIKRTFQFAVYDSELKELAYSIIKNVMLLKAGSKVDPSLYIITYIGFNFEGSKILLQLAQVNTKFSNYRTNAIYGTARMTGGEELAGEGLEVYIEIQPDAVFPTTNILTNYPNPQCVFTPFAGGQIDYLRGLERTTAGAKVTTITVSTAQGANAIQLAIDAITDASVDNQYVIDVTAGLYKITNSSQYIGGYPDSKAMIAMKDYVSVVGRSKEDCIIWAELPLEDADIDSAVPRNNHQTVWNWSDNTRIENVTLVAKLTRYVVHQDSPTESNKSRSYVDVDLKFIGNKSSLRTFGIGTWTGSKTYVIGGSSFSSQAAPFAIHNAPAQAKQTLWRFEGHDFINGSGDVFAEVQNLGSLVGDVIELIGCGFGSSKVMNYVDWWLYQPNVNDSYNGAEFRIRGYGNAPFKFNNTTINIGLGIKSATTGAASKVAFNKASSAFNAIMKNPHAYMGYLGSPERYAKNGVVYFDGAVGLSGYAIGGKSIREANYLFGTAISQDGLGKRLGDCTAVNKTLGVIIDGVTINVVFNKNYTALSNASIIADINTALGAAGTAYEYNIGRDYYPELTDVMRIGNNATNAPILKGTIVQFESGYVVPAVDGKRRLAVAIDDFPPHSTDADGTGRGNGRFITNAFVSLDQSEPQFIKRDSVAARYRVENGQLIADANGDITAINGLVLIK